MITCTFENETKTSLRHITVGAIVVNDTKEVLLVKRSPSLSRPNTWTIPGGFLDRDETTEQAVLRELCEETGYNGKIKFLFKINDNPQRPKEDRQNVDFIFIVTCTNGTPTLNNEVTKISWFDKEKLPLEEDFAFDHRESIMEYFNYLEKPFTLPVIG